MFKVDTYIHKMSSPIYIHNLVSTHTHQGDSNLYHDNHNLICMCNLKNYVMQYYKGVNYFIPFFILNTYSSSNSVYVLTFASTIQAKSFVYRTSTAVTIIIVASHMIIEIITKSIIEPRT